MSATTTLPDAIRVTGGARVYRLFDVGYQIDVETALERLATYAPARVRPQRGEAEALQIPSPPISVDLGTGKVGLQGRSFDVEISARIFDFGVVSLRARVPLPEAASWPAFTTFGLAVDAAPELPALLEQHLHTLMEQLGDAIERPFIAPVREDYSVYRIYRVEDLSGGVAHAGVLRDVDVVPLLLNETRPLSADARRELLPHHFSYYADDLAILTWDNALIVDANPGDTDVEYILEFANAQLLELRYYDALLDAELPKLYARIERARFGRPRIIGGRFAGLLGAMQTLVAETVELIERAENALKVTDDVYLARVYSAALELFRGRTWRAGVDRKLSIIRDTYSMLNAEAQAARMETLELAILLLIAVEIVLSLIH